MAVAVPNKKSSKSFASSIAVLYLGMFLRCLDTVMGLSTCDEYASAPGDEQPNGTRDRLVGTFRARRSH